MPRGYRYENIHHSLPNIIIVTVTLRKAKSTSSSAQIKLTTNLKLLILAENTVKLHQQCFSFHTDFDLTVYR